VNARSAQLCAGLAVVAALAIPAGRPTTAGAAGCDVSTTPAGFGAAVSGATAGQTVCLASGDYGTWAGTNKAITVTAAPGASPQMRVGFGPGDTAFTLAGMTGMGGQVAGGAHDFVIRDSTFTQSIDIEATNANILLDHNAHDWNATFNGGTNAKIFVWNAGGSFSGVTVRNSTIRNGNLDGIHLGGGAGIDVIGNVFANLCDTGTNHTDNIQFEGGEGGRIAGNYVFEPDGCATQGITSYDGGTHGVVIEDNVVDVPRDWGIELYADRDSIVRHNTLVYHPGSYSDFKTGTGRIDINRKSQDPTGSGTQVYDNLTTGVSFANGSTGTAHHNVSGQRAVFAGPLDTYAGFRLAPTSPVGLKAASDGLDAGARIALAVASPPPATPAPVTPPGGTPASPASRLVVAFGFGAASGRKVVDGSGHANAGTIHGARRIKAGRHGRALSFDGNDYVSVRDAASLDLTRGMTLEAWVRPAASGRRWRSVIVKPGAYALYADDRRGHAAARGRGVLRDRARLPRRRWSHLAATFDGKRLRVYVNGRLKRSRAVGGKLRTNGRALRIGQGFKGRIDDVRIWRTALKAAELRRHPKG
jgi:Concanavalin A-like lectin/glucanases superfamily/Right handed beta helix region